jgi:hypothetical protein
MERFSAERQNKNASSDLKISNFRKKGSMIFFFFYYFVEKKNTLSLFFENCGRNFLELL